MTPLASAVESRRNLPSRMRQLGMLSTLAVSMLSMASGCPKEPKMPETYPVRGKVVFSDGQPVPGGTVEFECEADPRIITRCSIESNGQFSLTSYNGVARREGAMTGPHRVKVSPPPSLINGKLPFPQKVFASSFTVEPKENEFTLTIERN
jgi:hypothetical protein